MLSIAVSLLLILAGPAAHAQFALVLQTGTGMTYYCEPLWNWSVQHVYYVNVQPGYTNGLLFYNPRWGAFKITVMENERVWGHTVEGHWSGDGTPVYGVTSNGAHYNTNLYYYSSAARDITRSSDSVDPCLK